MKPEVRLDLIISDGVLIACFLCYSFAPLERKRIRARWANFIFVASGVIGVVAHSASLLLRLHWFSLSSQADFQFRSVISEIHGLLLGWIFALILSGQLLGTKRIGRKVRQGVTIPASQSSKPPVQPSNKTPT